MILMVVLFAGSIFGVFFGLVKEANIAPAKNQKVLPMRTDAELAALYQYRITMRYTQTDEAKKPVLVEERAYTNDWTVRAVAEKMVYAPTLNQAIASAKGYELRINVQDGVIQYESPVTKYEERFGNGLSLLASFGNSWNVEIVDTRTGEMLFQETHDQPGIMLP